MLSPGQSKQCSLGARHRLFPLFYRHFLQMTLHAKEYLLHQKLVERNRRNENCARLTISLLAPLRLLTFEAI